MGTGYWGCRWPVGCRLAYPIAWRSAGSDSEHYDWTVSTEGDGVPEPFLETPFTERFPAFSPDGRWLAYASDETGGFEVYVRPFPGGEPVNRVSTAGGTAPLWSPDGRELFFRVTGEAGDRRYMVVDVTTGATFTRSQPRVLFESREFSGTTPIRSYDIAPDGERFAMVTSTSQVEQEPVTRINVVQNWFQELKERVPIP